MRVQAIGQGGKPRPIVHEAEPHRGNVWVAQILTKCGRTWVAGNAQTLRVTEAPVTCKLCLRGVSRG